MTDEQPDAVALHDQLQAECVQKARVVGAYWKQLKAEGVDDYDATRLTLDFQRRLIFPDVAADASDDPGACT
jgi:hypothetical protein